MVLNIEAELVRKVNRLRSSWYFGFFLVPLMSAHC